MSRLLKKYQINIWVYGYSPIQGTDSCWKYGTDLSCSSPSVFDIVPWIWQYPYIQMLIWYFSNNLDIYDYVGKLPEQHISVCLFYNPGDKIFIWLKLNEARISEWNLCSKAYILFIRLSFSYSFIKSIMCWIMKTVQLALNILDCITTFIFTDTFFLLA